MNVSAAYQSPTQDLPCLGNYQGPVPAVLSVKIFSASESFGALFEGVPGIKIPSSTANLSAGSDRMVIPRNCILPSVPNLFSLDLLNSSSVATLIFPFSFSLLLKAIDFSF